MKVTSDEWQTGQLDSESLLLAQLNLKIKGYVIIEDVFGEAQLKEIKDRFDVLLGEYVARTDPNRGASRYGMPLPFDAPFATTTLVANPILLQVVRSILGEDIVCSYFSSDTALSGSDYQQAHSDVPPLFPKDELSLPPFCYVINIPLVDFRPDNGPTEIWPYGTHLVGDPRMVPIPDFARIKELRESPLGRFNEEQMTPQQVITPAGSVVIRDIRMWHRGTPNRSNEPRPMMAIVYNRPWYYHGVVQMDERQFEALPAEVKQVFRKAVLTS
jgi:ectoine hydroxylase-related dioxygenase (phytanoyl-CoA dioxygenase family)